VAPGLRPAPPISWQEAFWSLLEQQLFGTPSVDGLFNQYRDGVPDLDQPDGAAIRRQNFRSYLDGFKDRPDLLLVGEAAGYRGGRFSGVAFTSERQLLTPGMLPFQGEPSSLHGPYTEISATLVWGEMRRTERRALHWNCVPVHAHKPGIYLSNRNPIPREVIVFQPLLEGLCQVLGQCSIVALGRRAELALTNLGIRHQYVRHPASGGAPAFRRDLRTLLGLS
jgi:hypothetical protein